MERKSKKKVFAAMSGGVDSSVAALLLAKNAEYEVIGCFIKGYNIDGCREVDAEDARRVAEKLKIPFYVWDFEDEYKKRVVDYMVDGYRLGITPNPDVMCNKEIKFGLFLKKALEMGADFVATGHYVRLVSRYISTGTGCPLAPAASGCLDSRADGSRFVRDQARRRSETFRTKHTEKLSKIFSLFIAKDENKDQSYFLWTLTQEQLKHCLFPIGGYLKSEVREIARKTGLPTAEKKDSQGICFLGAVKFKDFLKQYLPVKKGDILNIKGEKIGEHDGVWFYTIGQRHLKISPPKAPARTTGVVQSGGDLSPRLMRLGSKPPVENLKSLRQRRISLRPKISNHGPYYVVEKNIEKNILIVAEGENNPALRKKEVDLTDMNFINPAIHNFKSVIPVFARIRYRQPLVKAELKKSGGGWKLIFSKPVKFVAPGQSAVFYLPAEAQKAKAGDKKDEMLGGGVIV